MVIFAFKIESTPSILTLWTIKSEKETNYFYVPEENSFPVFPFSAWFACIAALFST